MSFQFVENGKIDGATRKLIRSHVMKGKNVGKVRTRPTRMGKSEMFSSCESYETGHPATILCKNIDGREEMAASVPRAVGNAFSAFTFPCQMQPYMRALIDQFLHISHQTVYPMEFCLPLNIAISRWFEHLLSDEACFHSTFAMSEVFMDSLLGNTETSLRALHHLSNTYRCIKQNLEKNGTPSDSTIAAVMSMAFHEDFRGQPGRSKVHVDALQRMVELRGGIAQFGHNRLLLQKICRADLQYALHFGSLPRFNRDEFPRGIIQAMFGQAVPEEEFFSLLKLNDAQVYDPELRDVLVDLMSVSRVFNDPHAFVKMEPYAYQEILMSVSYRLLHRYPLASDGPENENEHARYLGMLAMVTTSLFPHGWSRRLPYDLLAKRLRDAIERALSNILVDDTTVLWLLFAGGISVLGANDRPFLGPYINSLLFSLRIDSWEAAREKIKNLPWIDRIHDKPGQELWQAIVGNGHVITRIPDLVTETGLAMKMDLRYIQTG